MAQTKVAVPDSGSAASPAFIFNASPQSGFYHISSNLIGYTANGVKLLEFGASGFGLTNALVQDTSVNVLARSIKSGSRAVREYSDIMDGGKHGMTPGSIGEIVTTFNALYNATGTNQVVSCTLNSTETVTTASTSSLKIGDTVEGASIPANTHVVSITNGTTFVISNAATASTTETLTFTRHWTRDRSNDSDHSYMKRINESYEEEIWFSDCTTAATGILWQLRSRVQCVTGDNHLYGTLEVTQPPTLTNHVATKGYVDATAQGLSIKTEVAFTTTGNITLSGLGTQAGGDWPDILTAGQRILVKDQTTRSENGTYDCAAGAWVRCSDSNDTGSQTAPSPTNLVRAYVFVGGGTVAINSSWVMTIAPYTVGTTALVWQKFFSAGGITASNGVVKVGNDIQIDYINTDLAIETGKLRLKNLSQGTTGSLLKFAIDTKGRVISNASITSADILGLGNIANLTSPVFGFVNVHHPSATTEGYIYCGNGGAYMGFNGANWDFSGGQVVCLDGFSGNASSATTLSGDIADWATHRSKAVANMLGWRSGGNGTVIFDASNGTSPTGSAISNANSVHPWAATYPTLMGWNGTSTYGVRVDSARIADLAGYAEYLAAPNSRGLFVDTLFGWTAYKLRSASTTDCSLRLFGSTDTRLGTLYASSGYVGFLNSTHGWLHYVTDAGSFVASGNVSAYSDPRLKENFAIIADPFAIINQLTGGTFNWKFGIPHVELKAGKRDYGILADQVEAVMPEIVSESVDIKGDRYKIVCYEKLIPVLLEAIKNLDRRVTSLTGV